MYYAANIFWILIACYGLFFFESFMAWKKQTISLNAKTKLLHSINGITIKNIVGIIILGLPLIFFYDDWRMLMAWPVFNSMLQVPMILLLLIIIVVISMRQTIKESKKFFTNTQEVSRSTEISYLTIRVAFIVIYESFFRGLLLSISITTFGTTTAIVINVFLYTGIHLFNGRNQMLACIPFGLVVCGMTIWYHSILPVIALHVALALVNEIYLLRLFTLKPKTVRI